MSFSILPLTGQGSGGTATATLSSGAVNAVTLTAGGTNYINPPTVTITATGLTGVNVTAQIAAGAITGFTIVAGGSGGSGAVTVTITPAPGGPAIITGTGALPPTVGVDISGLTAGTLTVCVEVLSLTALKTMLLALELTTNAFGASVYVWEQQFIGQQGQGGTSFAFSTYNPTTDKRSSVIRQQLPFAATNYFGVASARARINVLGIDGSVQAVINAWLEVG
jgi:hypothetical protein